MNGRERLQRTMHFRPVDRAPMIEVGCWEQTVERWRAEGMPADTGLEESIITFNGNDFFGLDRQLCPELGVAMDPPFARLVLEEDERTAIIRNEDGVTMRTMKDGSSMPTYLAFPVRTREDFVVLKHRYDPTSPGRYPVHWDHFAAASRGSGCPVWLPGIGSVGLYSMLRRWLGTEGACTVFYDDPAWAEEMIEVIVDFTTALLRRALSEAQVDYFFWWEDFSFKAGPLVSPSIFRRFLLPGYRQVNDVLRTAGVTLINLDTDGDPRVLIPGLIESGINILYPLEQCSEEMHPWRIRQQYGHELALWGGIDKRVLARGREEIDQELHSKLQALLADGGYIPQLDHLAPPDIPYANWLYYLDRKRDMLGGAHV
jgi:hypothetical protein